MRYVKVAVPDDFDPQTCQIFLHTPLKSVEYPDIPDWKTKQIDVWQPIYENILDHGFLGLIDFMGDDQAVVNAARVSYGAGTKRVSEDRGLIRYLLRHAHTTPFEMCEIKFHVRSPMDAWRQWIRHRTANVNEYSTRYSVAIDAAQKTPPDKWRAQSSDNRQGSAGYLPSAEGVELTA